MRQSARCITRAAYRPINAGRRREMAVLRPPPLTAAAGRRGAPPRPLTGRGDAARPTDCYQKGIAVPQINK
eukprot:gene4232-biopygen9595